MVHATHQLFLRDACLYVLVISACSEINATEQAEYWLEHVKSFGKNSPVIIVGNKDDQAALHLDMGHLTQKYPNIVKFFPLSCTQARGAYSPQVDAFRQEFCRQLRALTTHQMHFTPVQFAVLESLRELTPKASFLSREEFVALCTRHHVDEKGPQDRAWLLDILDKLGVIIHFPQLPFMDGYVLNPRWLTYGVYTLMYSKRARLRQQDIVQILSNEQVVDNAGHVLAYPPDKCRLIMDAMHEFKLCYRLADHSDTLIIPALLPADQPAFAFDKTKALAFSFDFAVFLPRHIMPELIVQRHQEIDAETVWQTSVVLAHRTLSARALLQVDYHARTLQVWVSGRDARDYLMLLCDEIQTILDRIGIAYKEWITLPKATLLHPARARHGDAEERAPYRQLLAHAELGATEFIAESGQVYDVRKVLRSFTPDALPVSAPPSMLSPVSVGVSRTVKIFLASSHELLTDRDQFELYFRQQNDHYRAQGIYLEIVRWENFFDAVSATRKQDDYNAALQDCDIFLSLFFTKTGKYTEEEFTAAHAQFKSSGRPFIFTFFKDADISTGSAQRADLQSLWAFQDKLKALGHFYTNYKDAEHLKRQFTDQLKHVLAQGKPG